MKTQVFQINGARLWSRMMEMAQIGATPLGGVCRVALSDEDKLGRDCFIDWAKAAGCKIEIDQIGNIFARRPGRKPELPAIMIGSHLDSQPTGGKYDGVLGVLAGLEVIERLNDLNIVSDHAIEVVSWTNEEGARFAPAMLASGVFAGVFSLDFAYTRADNKGKLLGEELRRIAYQGELPVGNRPYKATFELHIEQGPILETENKIIGIVTGVQGVRWYDLVLEGKEAHAGPTPMHQRVDPIQNMLPILTEIYQLAEVYAPDARVTTGFINANPGVRNTVPGQLKIAIDLRHPDQDILAKMDQDFRNILRDAKGKASITDIWTSEPVAFDEHCIQSVRDVVSKLQLPAMEMVSGAGHDAVYVSQVAPTSMIFIPCKDGLSHNELESAKQEDVIAGANVLLNAVLDQTPYKIEKK